MSIFKNWLKIRHISRNNFGARGNNLTKLFHVPCCERGIITWVQFFGGLPPRLRIWEGKNRPKFGAILRNFTLGSQICPEWRKLSTTGQRRFQLLSLPRLSNKSDELWSTNRGLYLSGFDPPKVNFVGYHISPTRGRCRLKFLHVLARE